LHNPKDFIAWIKKKHEQEQQEKWENSTTTMKERNPHHIMNTNTKRMTRREQAAYARHPFCKYGLVLEVTVNKMYVEVVFFFFQIKQSYDDELN
jgi:hypothetical protein